MFENFRADERAIEGLPIRLVVALVVGVASLGILMQMLAGVSGLGVTEVDVRPTPDVVDPGNASVALRVVGPEGDGVASATVVARGGSARLDSVHTARTNESGYATMALDPALGANRADGEVTFTVKPPAGSRYADRRENTALLVVAD